VKVYILAGQPSRVLYVFLILRRDRRRIAHFNVTTNPTARWTAQQIVEDFPFAEAPRFLLRDRDRIYKFGWIVQQQNKEQGVYV